jgi:tetratricopeptide (TPR) repeat protein
MTPDLYSPCPCGSGKKFKWCCQPIWVGIEHALTQQANGQHDAALRIIDQVVKEHPGNPEAWGQKARLLYLNERTDDAEEALQKAFDINPSYPFGLTLRAEIRFQEGEIPGALLLARRATAAYDPLARDQLGGVYWLIFQCEDRMHRPVAARAALRLMVHFHPESEEVRQTFDAAFGDESPFPLAAKRDYKLLSPPGPTTPARRELFEKIRAGGVTPRLADLATTFETLTKQEPQEPSGWFNLGLSRAWLGENAKAIEALERYIELEPNESAAATAAALGEVLRLGRDLEDQTDYHQYTLACQIRTAEPVNNLLRGWDEARRLLPVRSEQPNVMHAVILETTSTGLVTVGRPASETGRLAGYLVIAGNIFQINSPVKEPFERLKAEVRQAFNLALGELHEREGPGSFREVNAEAVLLPVGRPTEEFPKRALEYAAHFYEDVWIHRPSRSLSGISPAEAVGSPRLRKKVLGMIQFLAECAADGMLSAYDFDRLRRKLGLLDAPPKAAPAAGVTTTQPQPAAQLTAKAPAVVGDISAMSAAELGALELGALADEQLEAAYQTAHRLSAEELTANFAQALVSRPARAERPDRFPWFSYLIQKSLREGNTTAALDQVNEGQKQDCEQNEGKRRNDYELRRAQVHVKRGEADEAHDIYQRLIERVPTNVGYRGDAAEAMLRLKQPARALQIATAGLEVARRQNDRDNEERLMDLANAAKRQGG